MTHLSSLNYVYIFEFQGKWELLSKAQSKKVKTRYEEELKKEKAKAERDVSFNKDQLPIDV